MQALFYSIYSSPIGDLLVASIDGNLVRLDLPGGTMELFLSQLEIAYPGFQPVQDDSKNHDFLTQLGEYFQGSRSSFALSISPKTTAFQKKVLAAVSHIPFGSTATYGEIAKNINNPKSYRAVGGANHSNPIPIIIPCHRIIGSNGSLTGYGGGLKLKKILLDFEREVSKTHAQENINQPSANRYWSKHIFRTI